VTAISINVKKMRELLFATVILLDLYCSGCRGILQLISLEAEEGTHTGYAVARSAASNQHTVRLGEGQYVENSFTTQGNCSVTVTDIVYTNDGGSDTITISLDGRAIDTFHTLSGTGGGHLWNVPRSSGMLGDTIELEAGLHQIHIEANATDIYQVEIDQILLTVNCSFSGSPTCYSLSSLPVVTESCSDSNMTGRVHQNSIQTACAEEDNIHIPVYYSNIQEYSIVATLPQYAAHVVTNNRDPDFTNCTQTSRLIWAIGAPDQSNNEFRNSCLSLHNFTIGDPPSTMCGQINSQELQQQTIVFSARGRSSGLVEASIGSLFSVTFSIVTGTLILEARCYGRELRWISLGTATFSPEQRTYTWHIPDLTWAEGQDNNYLQLVVVAGSTANASAFYDYLQLERRQERGETVTRIFNDLNTVIEVVAIDFWWLYPDAMTVTRMDSGQEWSNVSYFRISQRIPGTSFYPQVFVLYQDGNSRILTFPPPRLEASWIPFGSSVIIGASDPSTIRPYAAISRVSINIAELEMTVQYEGGGQAVISLVTNRFSTILKVSHISYTTNSSLPFATLRSMWVADGNSDADRVATENGEWNIQQGWSEFTGTNISFFRECVSQHNTLSPDIRILINCTFSESPTHMTSTPTSASVSVSSISSPTNSTTTAYTSTSNSPTPTSHTSTSNSPTQMPYTVTSTPPTQTSSTTTVESKAFKVSLEWLFIPAVLALYVVFPSL